jgi:hypothetical protein
MAAGCGGSANGEEAGAAPMTKAEFIKKADAICEETDKAQEAAQRTFEKKFPEADSSPRWEEKFVQVVGLPPIQSAAEEIGDLPVPSGDEEKVGAIVDGLEEAVDEARAEPGSMLGKGSVGPFTDVFKLAQDYGFKACATPI